MKVLLVTSEWPTSDRPASGPWVAQEVAFVRDAGVDIDVVSFRGARSLANYVRARREVKQQLAENRYDLIHAHFGHSSLLVLPTQLPFVVTFHGSDLLGIVGRRGRYTVAGWVLRRISRFAARRASKVIVVAENLSDRLPPRTDFAVNPMGVNTQLFRPQDKRRARDVLGLPVDRHLVLFSGDPAVARKRYGLATEVIGNLRKRLDVELVTVAGRPHGVVPTYMGACDALLVTARHEGSPTIVKEALACNLPVVSVDVGDVRQWIETLPGCELCADEEPRTIARALERVLTSKAPFTGRRIAESRLDERIFADRVKSIYQSVLSRNPDPRPPS